MPGAALAGAALRDTELAGGIPAGTLGVVTAGATVIAAITEPPDALTSSSGVRNPSPSRSMREKLARSERGHS